MKLWIAKKYFISSNKGSKINIISLITVLGIMFSTIAMIFVLSVFNGFEGLVKELYHDNIPDLKIESNNNQIFRIDSIIDLKSQETLLEKLKKYDRDIEFSEVLQHEIVIDYDKKINQKIEESQMVAMIKGIDKNYKNVNRILDYILVDSDIYHFSDLENSPAYYDIDPRINFVNEFQNSESVIMVGLEIANTLNLSIANSLRDKKNHLDSIKIWSLKISQKKPELFYIDGFINYAIFSISPEFDNQIFGSIEMVRKMFDKHNYCSAIEVKIKEHVNHDIQKKIQLDLGNKFIVKNVHEQLPFLYKMVKTERIAVYLIFILILIVTMINLIGALTIFMLQKKKDMFILMSMGASINKLKNTFMFLGQIIVLVGLFTGLILGIAFCFIQQEFHLIPMPGNFIIDFYPIDLQVKDLINIILIVYFIGLVTSFFVTRRKFFYKHLIYD